MLLFEYTGNFFSKPVFINLIQSNVNRRAWGIHCQFLYSHSPWVWGKALNGSWVITRPHSAGEQTQSLAGAVLAVCLWATAQPGQFLFENNYIVEYCQSFLEDFLICEVYENKNHNYTFP